MIELNIFDFVPETLRKLMQDMFLDFASRKAREVFGEDAARKIETLRSDAKFHQNFKQRLKSTLLRFEQEYKQEDEDLTEAILKDTKIFEDPSVQSAIITILKQPRAFILDENEILVQQFQTILPSRINRERVKNALKFLFRCLVEEICSMPEFSPIYSLEFQRISLETARQQLEFQKAELQALTELNTTARATQQALNDALANHRLLTSGQEVEEAPHPVLCKLPNPNCTMFFGRKEEIEHIHAILRPYPSSQEHIVTIDGIGGIGKSTLALEVARHYFYDFNQIPQKERFDAIVWVSANQAEISAKKRPFDSETIGNLTDIYSAIASVLDREWISRIRPENQKLEVEAILSRKRTLLIIDNLDDAEDEALLNFLREVPAPTKVIITSRYRLSIGFPIHLKGMLLDEANQLIQQQAARQEIQLDDEDIHLIYERASGVPMAIVWIIAQIGRGYPLEKAIQNLKNPRGDVARFYFKRVMDEIRNQDSGKLLIALSLFSLGADRTALSFVSGVPPLSIDDALVELEDLSLIHRYEKHYQMLPLTREYVSSELQADENDTGSFHQRFANYYNKMKIERTLHTKRTIDAVHLTHLHLNHLLVWKASIRDYYEANLKGLERGIKITRLFIMDRRLFCKKDGRFLDAAWSILKEQYEAGIDVRVLWTDVLEKNDLQVPPDLIIFDREEVHVHRHGSGGFYTEVDVINADKHVREWYDSFLLWIQFSQSWAMVSNLDPQSV